jgi:hypothetical protein
VAEIRRNLLIAKVGFNHSWLGVLVPTSRSAATQAAKTESSRRELSSPGGAAQPVGSPLGTSEFTGVATPSIPVAFAPAPGFDPGPDPTSSFTTGNGSDTCLSRAELKPGVRIANARGVPGTLGCLAFTRHDQRLVLLTTHHLLFDNEGREDEPVWLATGASSGTPFRRIGQSLYGRSRIVRLDGDEHYIDCAVASVSSVVASATALSPPSVAHAIASPGDAVTKTGAATGTTAGMVVDASYVGSVTANGRERPAPSQLLIRSLGGNAFAAEGDSGAVIVNSRHEAVGLLWGVNCRGDGVACRMNAVLKTMNITLAPMAHA